MNLGERNELLIKIKLIELRDKGASINILGQNTPITSVGFDSEYSKLGQVLIPNQLNRLSGQELQNYAVNLGVGKSPRSSKADVKINQFGYSLKSIQHAPPAIVNHTPRIGFEEACRQSNVGIEQLDKIIADYWKLRKAGTIREDVGNDNGHSPFNDHKDYLKPIINYFLFRGTGQGLSNHTAKYILDYSDPLDPSRWHFYDESNAVEQIWSKLVFSLRTKGMPSWYPNDNHNNNASVKKWTEYYQGGQRGSLHIRIK